MGLGTQAVWLVLLALPIASLAWTFTHEDLFREPREYCLQRSQKDPRLAQRKFFYLFTCEYCFSHYVTAIFLAITHFHLLFNDWRGYLIAGFALVWLANFYMNLFANIRLEVKKERVEIKHIEQKVESKSETADFGQNQQRAAA